MPDEPPPRPAPSATGTLAATPLAHALVFARNKKLSGTFELATTDRRAGAIAFWHGKIIGVRVTPISSYLSEVIEDLGYAERSVLLSTLDSARAPKRRHGEVLVERGHISPTQRDEALLEQIRRRVQSFFAWGQDTTYAFYDVKASNQEVRLSVDPLAAVWRGIQEHPPKASVKDVLSRVAGSPLRMCNENGIEAARLPHLELALSGQLASAPMTVQQLFAATTLSSARVELLIYLLVISKCIEPVSGIRATPSTGALPAIATVPSMPAARRISSQIPATHIPIPPPPTRMSSSQQIPAVRVPIPPPPARKSSSQQIPAVRPPTTISGEMRGPGSQKNAPTTSVATPVQPSGPIPVSALSGPAELGAAGIAYRAQTIDTEDPYRVLGIPRTATTEAVRAAFIRLARAWHPDRLPPELAAFRSEAQKVFSYISRANDILCDPTTRAALDRQSPDAPPPVRDRKDVMREIDGALGKRDFSYAEAAAARLAEADSDDAEAQAVVAWCKTLGGEAPTDTLQTSLAKLDRAIANDRLCERAYLYRGMLHKRLGNTPSAMRDFARVSALNPKQIDAQRELRLYEMRAKKSGEYSLDVLLGKTKKK